MKHEFGNICILGGTYDGEHAYLEVHDDGPGIETEQLEDLRSYLKDGKPGEKTASFGMKNVNARLKLEFGQDAGVEIESTKQDTCVRICFSMKRNNEETA